MIIDSHAHVVMPPQSFRYMAELVGGRANPSQIRAALGDWPVSAEAIRGGRAAYADHAWATRTRRRLAGDSARLGRLLADAGLEPLGGTSLFQLAGAPRADAVFDRLARSGILVRPFADGRRLRFGLPGRPADWARLAAALSESRS